VGRCEMSWWTVLNMQKRLVFIVADEGKDLHVYLEGTFPQSDMVGRLASCLCRFGDQDEDVCHEGHTRLQGWS
jgi:hypothetical protein